MKIEIEVTKTGRKGLQKLNGKVDGIADEVSNVLAILQNNACTQADIDRLANDLDASTGKLEAVIKRNKRK